MNAFAVLVLAITILSTGLFFWNLFYYLPARRNGSEIRHSVSVLIPARNEERSIESSLRAVLANEGVNIEIIVGDDHSEDRTADIVAGIAATDPRVHLMSVPFLPEGWCGKQFACHRLSELACYETLCFLDADVKLASDGLASMVKTLRSSQAALLSGFPKQEAHSWLEQILIPLMHFLLLGYLPMIGMRRTRDPAYGAGCGQLFVADAESYRLVGGHAAIKSSRHDGITLPRAFRRAGLITDLCDATAVAKCRMYRNGREVLQGLLKNATEGLASPGRIVPFSLLLFIGQVCPVLLLGYSLLHGTSDFVTLSAGASVALCYMPRMAAAWKFEQPFFGALFHPLAIVILLAIQWYAFGLNTVGVPSVWKGRSYSAAETSSSL